MDKFSFNRLIENPALVQADHVKALQKITEQYPCFQPAKILLSRAAHVAGHMNYERFLQQASAGMSDRKKLNYWINLINTTETIVEPSLQKEGTVVEQTSALPRFDGSTIPTEEIPAKKAVRASDDDLLRNIEESLLTLRQSRNRSIGINTDESDLVSVPKVNIFETILPFEQIQSEQVKKKEHKLEQEKKEAQSINKKALPQSLINEFLSTDHPKKNQGDFLFSPPSEGKDFFDYKNYQETLKEKNLSAKKDQEKIDEIAQHFPASSPNSDHIESSQLGESIRGDKEATFLLSYLEHNKRKRRLKNISKDRVDAILNKFIQEEPSIKPAQKSKDLTVEEDLSEESSKLNELPASENFAQLLILQGKFARAIEVFEELLLKNPEKKVYFASRIEDLKNKLYR